MMIPDDVLEQVRDAADVVGIIGESVQLKRTGSDWRGPCPFHGGTHRNFSVSPKRGAYYCFVCHEHGDVFAYLMKRFGMDFQTAVQEVARRSGIVIPERQERAGPDPWEPYYSAVAAAQDWFARQLAESPDAKAARDYLAGRDYPMDAVQPLGLGWAPPGREFTAAMHQLGIGDEVLLDTGLLVRRDDGSTYPRFRGRLLFPIHDIRGRVVGFGGRLLGPGEPKYLNSPETKIFRKGSLLYNLHHARGAIRKEGTVVLVEGYFDVLRLSLAGLEHVVAPLGTALTGDQASLLRRYAAEAILLYDADTAGLRATFRAGDELLRHGARVRVATMPPGEDPDTLVRTGGLPAIRKILHDAVDVMERKIQLLARKGWFEDVEHRRNALDRLLPTIRAAADPITRDLYLSLVAERVGVSRDSLLREVAAEPRRAVAPAAAAPRGPARTASAARTRWGERAELQLLLVMLQNEGWWQRVLREVPPERFESARLRDLLRTLVEARAPWPGEQPPECLGELQLVMWSRLKERAQQFGAQPADEVYADALQLLEARPEFRAIDALNDPIEKKRRKDDARARFPGAYARWYGWIAPARRSRRESPGDDTRNPPVGT